MSKNVDLFHRLNAAVNRGGVEYAIRHSTDDVLIIAGRSAVEELSSDTTGCGSSSPITP